MSVHLHSVFWAALGNSIYYLLATLKIVHAIREKTNVPWKTKWTPGLENVYSPKEKRGHQFSSVAQLCPTLCDSMDCSMPGLPVHHQLPEITQTHVHWVSDAIQPFHPLLSPSPPAFNISQHQGTFWWVSSLQQVAKVLEFQFQHQSFQWIFRTDFL